MTTLYGIRTNRWGDDERRLFARLSPVLGDAIRIVFNGKPPKDLPARSVTLDDAWVDANGLRRTGDWGWRCGDYALFALRAAEPGADFYWLIEPDVHFCADPGPFFDAFQTVRTDVLGYGLAPADEGNRFCRGMQGPHHRAIFCLTRFSGRALDLLLRARQDHADDDVRDRLFPNDEIHSFTVAVNAPDLSTGRLEDHAPRWFQNGWLDTDPDVYVGALPDGIKAVFHPARGRESFRGALRTRIANRLRFIRKIGGTFAALDESDLDEIATGVAADLRRELARLAGRAPPDWIDSEGWHAKGQEPRFAETKTAAEEERM